MATERIRGRKLQRIRERHFRLHPLCVLCQEKGRVQAAAELDHIQALINGGKDVESNRQGLCAECHRLKTAEDLGYTPSIRIRIGADGWPAE